MSFVSGITRALAQDSPTWLLPISCPAITMLSVKEPSGFCASVDKVIYWSKVVKIVSVMSVSIAAPSPIM